MEELVISDPKSKYKVYLESSVKNFNNIFAQHFKDSNEKIFLVTDTKVAKLHKDVLSYFQQKLNARLFVFAEGEQNKNIETVSRLYNLLIDNYADRSSTLIAFGGGVVGDLTGFTASTFMRGIKFINIPTTLTAQVDSCIGGKTGYNYGNIKNIVGSFYNPEFVYISTSFLETLSKEQLLDGMGEVIKYSLIRNRELLKFIEENFEKILTPNKYESLYIVKECLSIKADIIAKDYMDNGLRNILNFGHTIGHGIEADSNYSISHGIAVALGMLAALKLSEEKLKLSTNVYNQVESLYKKLGIPNRYKVDNYSAFLYAIRHDKKNSEYMNFVLLEDIGSCKIKIPVSDESILSAVKYSIDK